MNLLLAFGKIVALALLLFLPGFAWTLLLLRQVNLIERVAFSVGLSIVIVTLSLLFTNRLLGIPLDGLNSAMILLAVTILPLAAYYLNRLIKRRGGSAV